VDKFVNASIGDWASETTERLIDILFASYEERVSSIGTFIDTTYEAVQESQRPLLATKEERESINVELRERLARTSSLRRKDFDRMMQELLSSQREQEEDVRGLLDGYLKEQKAIVQELRDSLARVRDSAAEDKSVAVSRLHSQLKETPERQEQCRSRMCERLGEFQRKHEALTSMLKDLLARGADLKIRDFKQMLGRFQDDRGKRLARQQERKEETRNLLNEFHVERATVEAQRRKEQRVAVPLQMPSLALNS
jgi:hypothetical protein